MTITSTTKHPSGIVYMAVGPYDIIRVNRRHNNSINGLRHPYMHADLWVNGYFDFLFKPFMSESYRKRLMAIKAQARKEMYIQTDRVHFEKMKGRIKNTF